MLSKIQRKYGALASCYLADITLIAWLYFRSTNYYHYTQGLGKEMDSPNFQLQFYRLFLQSLTFALLLFLIAQTVVYILALRNFNSAYLYLKICAVFGFAVAAFITFSSSAYALLPALIYLFGYYTFAKIFKENSAISRSSPQSTIQ